MYSIYGKPVRHYSKKFTALVATLVLLSNSLAGTLLFLRPQTANAVTNYTEIPFTPTELSSNWAPDRTTPSGGYNSTSFGGRDDVLEMRIDTTNPSPTSGFYRTEGIQRQIDPSDTVKADLYVDSSWYSKDVRAGLWAVGKDGSGITAYPIVEFIANNGGAYTGWRVWDGVNGGWTNTASSYNTDSWNTLEISLNKTTDQFDILVNGNLVASNAGGGSTNIGAVILNSFNNANNDIAYNYASRWSKLSIGVDVPPTVSPCVSPSTVNSVNLASWDLSQTRATGHNEITEDGLRIYTEGATSTDKAAGYYTTNFALSDLGDQTIAQSIDYDISSGFGLTPGLQLVTDFDNNGTPDGILVGESIYGNNWWLTNSASQFVKDDAPNVGGGNGSNWFGTPNEWLTKFPDAKVKAIGYSLGSGVYGDGVIKRISLGCVNYTFDLPPPNSAPVVNFVPNSPNEGAIVNGIIVPRVTATDDYGMGSYYIRLWKGAFESGIANLVSNNCSSAPGAFLLGTSQDITCPFIDTTLLDDGVYVLSAQFQDGHIVWGQALRTIIIDNSTPNLPIHELPADNSFLSYNDFWFEWADSAGSVSYEIQYSQNPALNGDGAFQNVQWTGDYQTIQPTDSRARSVGANGTWYWQVRSVGVSGNKSAWTSPWKVTIDMNTPSVPTASFAEDPSGDSVANGGLTDSQYFGFTLSSSIDTIRYQLKYWNDIPASPFKLLTPWNPSDLSGYSPVLGTYKDNFTQGNGVHYFSFSACDSAGNCSAYSSPFAVTYDSTAPTISIDSFSAVDNVITPSVTATDTNGPLTYSWTTDPDVTISDTTVKEPLFTANADGIYSFTLTATDPAGNTASATFGFTYTAPVVEEEEEETPAPTPAVTPPAVLGASTTAPLTAFRNVTARNSNNQTNSVPEETAPEQESTPEVQGSLTQKVATTAGDTVEKVAATETSKNFLGLGWWWLPLLLVSAIIFWLIFGRDDKEDEQA